MRVALIGVGAIGSYLLEAIRRGEAGAIEIVALADLPAAEPRLRELAAELGCPCETDAVRLADHGPELIVEAASQAAVRQHAVPLVERGVDLLVMSVGALADGVFLTALAEAAERVGRRVHVPAGAIGALDVLRAARLAGLDDVTLTTSKPPRALSGAPFFAERGIDPIELRERTVVFEGAAREAVTLFPANVNVAAAVSLSGVGPERTRVQVVADPALSSNVHELTARGAFGEMSLRVANVPSPANPKTSLLACLSPLAMLRALAQPVRLG